jgi:hypothetical protein
MGGHYSMKHEEEEPGPHVPPAPVVKHLRVRRQPMEAPHRPLPVRETSNDDDDGIISAIAAVEIAQAIESTPDTTSGGSDSGFSGFDGGNTGGGGSGGDS